MTTRSRLSRRAKESVAEKTRSMLGEDDSADDSADDSMSDPDWGDKDKGKHPLDSDDDHAENYRKKVKRGRINKSFVPVRKPGRSPVVAANTASTVVQNVRSPEPKPLPLDLAPENSDEDDGEPVHNFQKLDYVLNPKDVKDFEMFPVWRIEGGGLLQRFLPHREGAVVVHKASSAYTTWRPHMQESHRAILVASCSGVRGTEMVRVLTRFLPKRPDKKITVTEKDPVYAAMTNYLQVTCSQAMEDSFLQVVSKEKDGFHKEALAVLEKKAEEQKERLLPLVAKWEGKFKDCVMSRPLFYEEMRRLPKGDCVVDGCGEAASHVMHVKGATYCPKNLTQTGPPLPANVLGQHLEEYRVCGRVRDLSLALHHLTHFRMKFVSLCNAQVVKQKKKQGAESMPELLEACLADTAWALRMLKKFKKLMKEALELYLVHTEEAS